MLLTLVKMVHLVALGLWAGAMFFFSFFTALPIIGKVPELMTRPDHWLQLSDAKAGTRVAGEVLDILFQRYFPFQAAVGIVTVLTAVWLATVPGWLGKIRLGLLALALLLLAVNWMVLAPAVHQARSMRYAADPQTAAQGEAEFGPRHTKSLMTDMATLALVLIGLALAACMPDGQSSVAAAGSAQAPASGGRVE